MQEGRCSVLSVRGARQAVRGAALRAIMPFGTAPPIGISHTGCPAVSRPHQPSRRAVHPVHTDEIRMNIAPGPRRVRCLMCSAWPCLPSLLTP
jgi:hypothetical protein